VASRDALASALAARPPRRWAAMAAQGSRLDLLGTNITPLGDAPRAYAAAEGFILLGSGEWSDRRQALLIDALRAAPRPVLVGNPDIVAPRETSLSLEPGWYAHDLARAPGVKPEFFGKPFANVFDLVRARLGPGIDPRRIAMVGDTLHTDVLGGKAQGFGTVLVHRHGLFADLEVAPYIARSGIRPDFIAETT
jgi:ribonucleotide monophosphatase NagD (HAD superfamily)